MRRVHKSKRISNSIVQTVEKVSTPQSYLIILKKAEQAKNYTINNNSILFDNTKQFLIFSLDWESFY